MLIGALLGLAFFTKQSALLLYPFFLLWATLVRRERPRAWIGLAVTYAVAGWFVLFFVLAPDVPSMWSEGGGTPIMYHHSYTLTVTLE